ncbi:MAG: hydrogenase maturation protease [Crenarchaeota archaeon]|nr:hydrogenase maturation protease [Thermoproteota archaeon]
MKALLIGLGNRNLGDDGLGSCLAEALEGRKPHGVDVLDGDDMGLGLVGWLEGYDLAVFVDAAEIDEDVRAFKVEPHRASEEELKDLVQDTHKVGPVALAALAARSGVLKGKAYLVAFKPSKVCFMCPPSEEGIRRAVRAAELANKILKKEGFPTFELEGLEDELIRICAKSLPEAPWEG